jgi:Ubiquitin-activating enzyme active site
LSVHQEDARVFLESVRLFLDTRPPGAAVFDKDDDLAVEFVTAAANLRAASYGIQQQTLFDAKARLRTPFFMLHAVVLRILSKGYQNLNPFSKVSNALISMQWYEGTVTSLTKCRSLLRQRRRQSAHTFSNP